MKQSLMEISNVLSASGFSMVLQERKGFPVVNATFFKSSRLSLKWVQHRSRALILGLLPHGGSELSVANVHLEAGGSGDNQKQRASQLASVLKRITGDSIICGDFNSCLTCGSTLSTQLVDAGLARAPTKGITLAQTSGYSDCLDHLWSSHALVASRVLTSAPAALALIEATGMPDAKHPSDHLPVAATFTVKSKSQKQPQWLDIPVVNAPAAPDQTMQQEWLQICWCAGVGGGRNAEREQKRLEAAFLQMLSDSEASNLRCWRDAARSGAKSLVSTAVCKAITVLNGPSPSKAWDPGIVEPNLTILRGGCKDFNVLGAWWNLWILVSRIGCCKLLEA
jgi:hypothetical protein